MNWVNVSVPGIVDFCIAWFFAIRSIKAVFDFIKFDSHLVGSMNKIFTVKNCVFEEIGMTAIEFFLNEFH